MLTRAREIQAIPLSSLAPKARNQLTAANLAAAGRIAVLEPLLYPRDSDGD